jgi:6,7-dimethyl-8-ribityllumazine synthase
MSGESPEVPVDVSDIHLGIVAGRWHDEIVSSLIDSALSVGARTTVHRVPGAFEIPVVAGWLATSRRYDGVVALGVVIRGGTPHFDYVCRAVTDGCLRVALDTGVPVGFGVLTCDTVEQARERLDKGREAVLAVAETIQVLRGIRAAADSLD